MGCIVVLIAAGVALTACGDGSGDARAERVPTAVAERLPQIGQLYELCPVTDVDARDYERRARQAREQAELLIREVRRRADARVTLTFEDAHTGERLTEETTVRRLAEEHLRRPGVEGVPCARSVMAELEAATEGRPPPDPPPRDDPVYLMDDVVDALRLRKDGGIYRSRHCREIQIILTTTEEVQSALTEPAGNVAVIADLGRGVGVEAFRPTPACRREIAAGLSRVRPFR